MQFTKSPMCSFYPEPIYPIFMEDINGQHFRLYCTGLVYITFLVVGVLSVHKKVTISNKTTVDKSVF